MFSQPGENFRSIALVGIALGAFGCSEKPPLPVTPLKGPPVVAPEIIQTSLPPILDAERVAAMEQERQIQEREARASRIECIEGCVHIFPIQDFAIAFSEFQDRIAGEERVLAVSIAVPRYEKARFSIPQERGAPIPIAVPVVQSDSYIVLTTPIESRREKSEVTENAKEEIARRAASVEKINENTYFMPKEDFFQTLAEFSLSRQGTEEVVSIVLAPPIRQGVSIFASRSGESKMVGISVSDGYLVFTRPTDSGIDQSKGMPHTAEKEPLPQP